jgi:hypothetical protein
MESEIKTSKIYLCAISCSCEHTSYHKRYYIVHYSSINMEILPLPIHVPPVILTSNDLYPLRSPPINQMSREEDRERKREEQRDEEGGEIDDAYPLLLKRRWLR